MKKFYIFYDDDGTIKSVGRVYEGEANEFEVEREIALEFLQGKKNPRDYSVKITDNTPELTEIVKDKIIRYNADEVVDYDNPGFTQLEKFNHDDEPDLNITYYKATGYVQISKTEPFDKDTKFYVTPKNNPVEIVVEIICDEDTRGKTEYVGENLSISIISWQQTGLKINYMEF